ncbi:hypothetical protein [Rhizobium sp. Root651]|uniref:hypothetical protein n=1 Tax=Rhizobium sp. Root651 TaxID=1736577 RepID=UPI000714D7FE|nr:hypothetical protein [Rhizobium sp. Root651]KRA59006.1 hypothetical protein ASD85_15065 [Rhizobium sp. Root651]
MSHYRKIDVRIWNDEKFNTLSADGKLAFFMVLTHPMLTALGAMRGTPEGLASEVGMDIEPFKKGFSELLSKRLAEHDRNGKLIALPNFLKYNPPANPNAVKSWVKVLDFLPECELRKLVIQRARAAAQGFKEPLPEPFTQGFIEPESREQRAEIHNKEHIHGLEAQEDTYTRESFSPGYDVSTGEVYDDSGTYDNWYDHDEVTR